MVINAVVGFVLHRGFRCCVVFGPDDVVFCEPDGTTTASAQRPNGGIRLDGVPGPLVEGSCS